MAPLNLPLIVKVLDTEKNFKKIIKREINSIYGSEEQKVREQRFVKDFRYLNWDLYNKFMISERKNNPQASSYLNVLSLKDSIRIIERYWDDFFKGYFNCDDWDLWKEDFWLCARKRNPLAHGQEERISKEERQALSYACDRINRSINRTIGADGTLPAALSNLTAGDECIFYGESTTKQGGIRGYFYMEGQKVRAILRKEDMTSELLVKGLDDLRPFPVVIIEENPRETLYFVRPKDKEAEAKLC